MVYRTHPILSNEHGTGLSSGPARADDRVRENRKERPGPDPAGRVYPGRMNDDVFKPLAVLDRPPRRAKIR